MANRILVCVGLVLVAFAAVAAAGGMMGGMGNGMGSGMIVTADDGSILISRLGSGMMSQQQRALVNISSNGSIRWRSSFTDRWPMMPGTKKNLVVVPLVDAYWMGGGAKRNAVLEGLDLSTGAVLWNVALDGQMASYPQFSRDGKRIYLTVGDYSGTYTMTARKVVALDLNGTVLWTVDITGTTRANEAWTGE